MIDTREMIEAIEMTEGTRDIATITTTTTLTRSLIRTIISVIIVVNLDTSDLNAQRGGSQMIIGTRLIRRAAARGTTPLKVYQMSLFALNLYLLLLFRIVGL
jgi:hypothetical protein